MNWEKEYYSKFKTAREAVKIVKSGDMVAYGEFAMLSQCLDSALAERVHELQNVNIRVTACPVVPDVIKADPESEHFRLSDWHFSPVSRKLGGTGLVKYIPANYHYVPEMVNQKLYGDIDVAFLMASPPDEYGYISFGPSCSITPHIIRNAKHVVVEISSAVPVCFCRKEDEIHISQIDTFVMGDSLPLPEIAAEKPTETDMKIARTVVNEIRDGSCLQLGIGAMPNAVGELIAQAGLKDLGIHSEMFCEAFMSMYEAGCISGKYKTTDPGKSLYTFALGSKKLYDFLDGNKNCMIASADYTNDPLIVSKNDNLVCINNAISVDLYGQVSSESSGTRQISGTGGQLDFMEAASRSRNGKGIICLSSTFKDKQGTVHSRIVPHFDPCTIVTVPRSWSQYVVTEYGIVDLRGKDVAERAEALINIAHPDFREELISAALRQGIRIRASEV